VPDHYDMALAHPGNVRTDSNPEAWILVSEVNLNGPATITTLWATTTAA